MNQTLITPVSEQILGSCAIQAKAYEQCADPWPAQVKDDDETAPVNQSRAEQAVELKTLVKDFNSVSARLARCNRIGRAAVDECAGGSTIARAVGVSARNINRLLVWQQQTLNRMGVISRQEDAPFAANCLNTPRDGASVLKCYLLERNRTKTRLVYEAQADELPLTVGMSPQCTFTVLPDGRLLTADHCGARSTGTGLVMKREGAVRVSATFVNSLKLSSDQWFTGRSFEDLSVFKTDARLAARPFYILTRDERREEGCAVVEDLYLACAPVVYRTMTGRRAHVLGFPSMRYPARDQLESVILADGDLVFDRDTDRLLLHAAFTPGASGGPVYLDKGERFGDWETDRAVYLGPASTFSTVQRIRTAFDSDMLVIVPTYTFERVHALSPAP